MSWIYLAALIASLLAAGLAQGETVRLKNGTVIQGSIVQMTETDLTLDTADMGRIQIKRRAVQGFEDDVPAVPSALPAAPIAAVAPAAAPTIAINNNNNNNNNNSAATSAAATAALTPPPAPAPAMTAPSPPPSIAEGEGPSGMVLGAIGGGMTYLRRNYGPDAPASATGWTKATPTAHWDLIGYRWASGLDVMVFADGTSQQEDAGLTWQWMQAGLRFDTTFGRHSGPLGMGEFHAGLGVAHTVMSMKATVGDDSSGYYDDNGNWIDNGGTQDVSMTQEGTAGVGCLGYRTLSAGGLGLDVALTLSQARLEQATVNSGSASGPDLASPNILQTVGLTVGLTYAL